MSQPMSAFHSVPKLTLPIPAIPATADKETTIPISIRKVSDVRCVMCAQNIFNKPYTEISHQPFSKEKEAICSSECFHKWTQLEISPQLTPSPLISVLYKKRIHEPVMPPVPSQKSNQ